MAIYTYGDIKLVKKVHLLLEDDIYKGLWEIVKARYTAPVRKLSIVANELLRKAIEEEKQKLGIN